MTRWTFGQKLAAGFGSVILLTVISVIVALRALDIVVTEKDRVLLVDGQDLVEAQRIRASMQALAASFRGHLITGEQRYLDEIQAISADLDVDLSGIESRGSVAARDLIAGIRRARTAYQNELGLLSERRQDGEDLASLSAAFEARAVGPYNAFAGAVDEFVRRTELQRDAAIEASSAAAERAGTTLEWVGGLAVIFGLIAAFLLGRSLKQQVGSSVQLVRSSSAELQAAATQQASGAREQATAMTEITTTISELLATSRQIAESGQHVAKMAAESAHSARAGEASVQSARQAVHTIKSQVDTIVEHMLDLGRKSQQIGGIVEIITELSEQTNILAINATIEAAVAGDAGRRFAAVGEEIRKLADRVGGSTKEIRTLIEEIRTAVNRTVMATETGSKSVDAGAERFEQLQQSFTRIGELVASTMEAGREIELSTKQQASAVEQVNVAVSNVAQATKESEASSQQTLQAVSQLASMAGELSRFVQPQAA